MTVFYVHTRDEMFTIPADSFERHDRDFYGFYVSVRESVLRETVGVFRGRTEERIERTQRRWKALIPASAIVLITTQPIERPASGTPTRRAETTGSVAEGDGGPVPPAAGDAQTASQDPSHDR